MKAALLASLLLPAAAPATSPRADYLLHCAGCHGLRGRAEPARVPALVDLGRLACSAAGRAYVVRLPNVSLARGMDDATLARLLNYVATELGDTALRRPFTAGEVRALRAAPRTRDSLAQQRAGAVEASRACQVVPDRRLSLTLE